MALNDDAGYGQAMWRGMELYESAGDLPRMIAALETFIGERPSDPLTPDAQLRLGGAYHASGLFDKAIAAYRECQLRYPRSLAASKAGVPLARAFIAKGPDSYRKAEVALRQVIEDNPQITPDAQEFREALLELAHLYFRTTRYEQAISRLEELTQRYPEDARMGQLLFLMGDSYRKSAGILGERLESAATTRPALNLAEATRARTERLTRARELYDRVLSFYRGATPGTEIDRLYQKLAHFYRADCVYDLGNYIDAIKLYDDAAFRYQDDPAALVAYVQIVNANVALGRIEEAKAANERAKWMLRRMPAEVFEPASYAMPKVAWEQWLKWSGDSGIWK
jgi:tetratricopeptide (TPR) repeat protein